MVKNSPAVSKVALPSVPKIQVKRQTVLIGSLPNKTIVLLTQEFRTGHGHGDFAHLNKGHQ